jgi:hypothetical protein
MSCRRENWRLEQNFSRKCAEMLSDLGDSFLSFRSMPAGCARSASGNQSLLRENRRLFVRAQTVRLENDCKVVKRTLWRSDGCALDWVLDRDNGTYREWWPADCTDRAAFAKSVSARCRSLGSDRRVLGVKLLPDVVEVSWTTIVEVPPSKAPKKSLSVSGMYLSWKRVTEPLRFL